MNVRVPQELTPSSSIFRRGEKEEERLLCTRMKPFDPAEFSPKELRALVRTMRLIMKREEGIGLSANQVGLNLNLCIVEPPREGASGKRVWFAVGNPVIVKRSQGTTEDEEGCLSVPTLYGAVPRYEKITVEGIDMNGKKLKIKARGLLARIFQHEIDHLNG